MPCVIHLVVVARIENFLDIVGFVVDAKCGLLNLIQLFDDHAPTSCGTVDFTASRVGLT
jgi:hypothetical protein